MEPYYQEEGLQLYLGDCRDILPKIAKGDLTLTDPPYEQAASGGGIIAKRKTYEKIQPLSNFETLEFLPFILGSSVPSHGYIFCSKNQVPKITGHLTDLGMNWDLMVYGKNNPIPTNNNCYVTDCEFIVFYRTPRVCFFNSDLDLKKYKKIKMVNCSAGKYGHPTEKNVQVLRDMIEISTYPGQTVIDPFCGSGSTLEAARSLGRKAIGIEINEDYIKGAIKRLQQQPLLIGV